MFGAQYEKQLHVRAAAWGRQYMGAFEEAQCGLLLVASVNNTVKLSSIAAQGHLLALLLHCL